jgi:hypothetical protein
LSFKYSLFLFLKCLLASRLTLLTSLGSCSYCSLACLLLLQLYIFCWILFWRNLYIKIQLLRLWVYVLNNYIKASSIVHQPSEVNVLYLSSVMQIGKTTSTLTIKSQHFLIYNPQNTLCKPKPKL